MNEAHSPDGATGAADRTPAGPDHIGPSDAQQLPGGKVDGGSPGGRGALDFDDDEVYSGRGDNSRTGGTAASPGADSGRLAPPSEQLSPNNLPSDPDEYGASGDGRSS